MLNKKRILAAVCAAALLAGCSSKGSGSETVTPDTPADTEGVDLKDMLSVMSKTERELGLEGKYEAVADIQDGTIDPELAGTWTSKKNGVTYHYQEDGQSWAESEYGNSDPLPYTCITVEGYKVVAEEMKGTSYKEDGTTEEYLAITYTVYTVKDGILYIVPVDSVDEYTTFSVNQVIAFTKEGSDVKENVSLKTVYGTWETDEGGTIVIDEKGLSVTEGSDELSGPYPVSVNEEGELVIDVNGTKTAYGFAIAMTREYENGEQVGEPGYALSLSYTGKDENDRPNLADIMTDWHAEYDYEQFLFNLSANSPKE